MGKLNYVPTAPVGVEIHNLMSENSDVRQAIQPTDPVYVLNRGRREIRDMFDGDVRVILPGWSVMTYAQAKHFQGRAIVPGTKDPNNPMAFESFLAIKDIDPEYKLVPFTDGELRVMREHPEAFRREEAVVLVDPRTIQAAIESPVEGPRATAGRPGVDVSEQGTKAAAAAAANVLDRPDSNDARDEAEEIAIETQVVRRGRNRNR